MELSRNTLIIIGVVVVVLLSCSSMSSMMMRKKEDFQTRDKERFSVKIGDSEYEFKPPRFMQ